MTRAAEPGFKEATAMSTGRLGIWCFLASEVVIFGGLIVVYLLFRSRHPEWSADAAHMLTAVGAINTAVLLASGRTMFLAHAAVGRRDLRAAVRNLGFTLLGGCVFLGIKGFEYSQEIRHGFTPVTNLFWSFYYVMTGLHALHILGGLVALAVILLGVRRGRDTQRVEYVGMYWYFVDVVWIFLFSLLYLFS
jgi:heme/copper-type cytochrome/quinol oxidase subunit 3